MNQVKYPSKPAATALRLGWCGLVWLQILIATGLAAPVVSNVRGQQRPLTQLVDVYYVLSESASVNLEVSADGGATWNNVPATSASQSVGPLVSAGIGKYILWNAGADWPGQYSSAVRFKITAYDGTVPSGMVLIPAGNNSGTDPDFGAYSLTVSSFYMDKYEVTKALWDEVRNWNGGNGYTDLSAGDGKAAKHPVHSVSWYDVVKWCNARSEKEGRVPVYYTDAAMTLVYKTGQVKEPYVKTAASGYRLPTDVQWEYAARGGVSSRRFPWGGDTIDHGKANYYGVPSGYSYDTGYEGYDTRYSTTGYPYTSPVGAYESGKNGYGLYDMAGNVWEWCYDWYPGYVGSYRVVRGGGWLFIAYRCRVGYRYNGHPDDANYVIGFRAALPPGQ